MSEGTLLQVWSDVLNRTGVVVKPDDIEPCHRLYNGKTTTTTTTVKFSKRKLCQQVFWIVDPRKFDFPEGTAIFINENLCSYYKILWNTCKKLWEKKLIQTYFTSNGNIQYRIREKGMFIHLHMLGFKKKNLWVLI